MAKGQKSVSGPSAVRSGSPAAREASPSSVEGFPPLAPLVTGADDPVPTFPPLAPVRTASNERARDVTPRGPVLRSGSRSRPPLAPSPPSPIIVQDPPSNDGDVGDVQTPRSDYSSDYSSCATRLWSSPSTSSAASPSTSTSVAATTAVIDPQLMLIATELKNLTETVSTIEQLSGPTRDALHLTIQRLATLTEGSASTS